MEDIRDNSSHADLMDKIYGFQRHFYDATRRYFLLGRNRLLTKMDIQPGQTVLEMGCGTARNLIKLVQRHPEALFYGLDVSSRMLATAQNKICRGTAWCISLQNCPAENLDHLKTFGLVKPFDHIFFSYSLTMIPNWRAALDAAYANLAPGGRIYIVDFWDQSRLPAVFRGVLRWWLGMFHVKYEPDLIPFLTSWREEGRVTLELESVFRSYSMIMVVTDNQKNNETFLL